MYDVETTGQYHMSSLKFCYKILIILWDVDTYFFPSLVIFYYCDVVLSNTHKHF